MRDEEIEDGSKDVELEAGGLSNEVVMADANDWPFYALTSSSPIRPSSFFPSSDIVKTDM